MLKVQCKWFKSFFVSFVHQIQQINSKIVILFHMLDCFCFEMYIIEYVSSLQFLLLSQPLCCAYYYCCLNTFVDNNHLPLLPIAAIFWVLVQCSDGRKSCTDTPNKRTGPMIVSSVLLSAALCSFSLLFFTFSRLNIDADTVLQGVPFKR